MTVFVERQGGAVVGVYANLQPGRAEEALADDHADVLAFFNPPPDLAAYAAAIQAHVDAAAHSKGYESGFALAGYAASTVPAWADEAAAFIAWRDVVWGYAYGELAKVEAHARTQPSVAELVAELPEIDWPA